METFKKQVRRLGAYLTKEGFKVPYNKLMHAIAAVHGKPNWQTLIAGGTQKPETPQSSPIKIWGDLFENVDTVGQSEFRALSELCADAINLHNIGGEVEPTTPIPTEDVQHISGVCSTVIEFATEAKSKIASVPLKAILIVSASDLFEKDNRLWEAITTDCDVFTWGDCNHSLVSIGRFLERATEVAEIEHRWDDFAQEGFVYSGAGLKNEFVALKEMLEKLDEDTLISLNT